MSDEDFLDWLCEDWTSDQQQQCIALFAELGSGKSTLWQHLAFRAQQKYADAEVFLIYLNDLKDGTIDGNTDVERAVTMLEDVISDVNMKLLLKQQQKVIIFMDAFDELREESKRSVFRLIGALRKSKNNVKFVLSSRERCRKELIRRLKVKSIYMVPFDKVDRREFLRLFWNVEDTTEFNDFSMALLSRFERDAPRGDFSFLGLPLSMKMLAEVFKESFEKYLESTEPAKQESLLPLVSNNITNLYEQFTTKCISQTLNKTWKLDVTVASFERKFDPQIKTVIQNYQLIAMKLMGLGYAIKGDQKTTLKKFHETIRKGEAESLLLETVGQSPRFAHRSYQEYFCATYLFDQLCNSKESNTKDLGNILREFTVIRRFFLKMLDGKLNSVEKKNHKISTFLRNETDSIEAWACDANCSNLLSKVLNVDNLKSTTDGKETLFHIAAESNACESMKILLEACTNIDVENEAQATPLYVACKKGHLEMVKLLVEIGRANVKHRLHELRSPLRAAVERRWDRSIIEFLISDAVETHPGCYSNKNLALYHAVDDLDLVRWLIQQGATVDFFDSYRQNALHWAACWGGAALVEELLKCSANVNAQDSCEENSALHMAANRGALDIVRLLISRGALVDQPNYKQQTALHRAAKKGDAPLVAELLDCGANVNAQDKDQNTALHFTVATFKKFGQYLMEEYQDSDSTHGHKVTIETMRFPWWKRDQQLHQHDSPDPTSTEEEEPFHYAHTTTIDEQDDSCEHSHYTAFQQTLLDTVKVLIAGKANVNLTGGSRNRTVLHVAAGKGATAIVEELLKCGADINARDGKGRTALDCAMVKDHADIVRLLVSERANRCGESSD